VRVFYTEPGRALATLLMAATKVHEAHMLGLSRPAGARSSRHSRRG
jgi:hypothetical protein